MYTKHNDHSHKQPAYFDQYTPMESSDNIGKIPQEENDRYYLEQYHKETLSKVDFEELLKDEKEKGNWEYYCRV